MLHAHVLEQQIDVPATARGNTPPAVHCLRRPFTVLPVGLCAYQNRLMYSIIRLAWITTIEVARTLLSGKDKGEHLAQQHLVARDLELPAGDD